MPLTDLATADFVPCSSRRFPRAGGARGRSILVRRIYLVQYIA